jgi:hypothetical protein
MGDNDRCFHEGLSLCCLVLVPELKECPVRRGKLLDRQEYLRLKEDDGPTGSSDRHIV